MSHGHALPATHIAVQQIGPDLVSSFVFDDGLADARGVAVVMTPKTTRAVVATFLEIKVRSQVLEQPATPDLRGPDSKGYILHGDPINAHAVDVIVAEDSGVVVLGFQCVDLAKTLAHNIEHQQVRIQTTAAPSLVVLSVPTFLNWVSVLEKHLSNGSDNGSEQ